MTEDQQEDWPALLAQLQAAIDARDAAYRANDRRLATAHRTAERIQRASHLILSLISAAGAVILWADHRIIGGIALTIMAVLFAAALIIERTRR